MSHKSWPVYRKLNQGPHHHTRSAFKIVEYKERRVSHKASGPRRELSTRVQNFPRAIVTGSGLLYSMLSHARMICAVSLCAFGKSSVEYCHLSNHPSLPERSWCPVSLKKQWNDSANAHLPATWFLISADLFASGFKRMFTCNWSPAKLLRWDSARIVNCQPPSL